MIKLIASAPDGWAFVQDGESLWLLRPPYGSKDRDRQTDSQVARALAHEDFEFRHAEFEGWGGLCRRLQRERVERATEEERAEAIRAPGKILARATAAQVEKHLEAIDEAMLLGHLDGARDALLALMRAPSVLQSPTLQQGIVDRLEKAIAGCRGDVAATDEQFQSWHVEDESKVARQAESLRVHEGFMNVTPAA